MARLLICSWRASSDELKTRAVGLGRNPLQTFDVSPPRYYSGGITGPSVDVLPGSENPRRSFGLQLRAGELWLVPGKKSITFLNGKRVRFKRRWRPGQIIESTDAGGWHSTAFIVSSDSNLPDTLELKSFFNGGSSEIGILELGDFREVTAKDDDLIALRDLAKDYHRWRLTRRLAGGFSLVAAVVGFLIDLPQLPSVITGALGGLLILYDWI